MDVLEKFGMQNCNYVHNPIVSGIELIKDEGGVKVNKTNYKQTVGSLMYLTATRPDMMFVVSLISQYIDNPSELHFQVAKRVLRYLKGTIEFGISYKQGGKNELVAYINSDNAEDKMKEKARQVT